MTATELKDIFTSSQFKQELEEISSYLASIMQERPIVHLLAKCLWKNKQKYEFELEHKKVDLTVNGTKIEFKFNYDKMGVKLEKELKRWVDNLAMPGAGSKWGVLPRIYEDVCKKEPDIFVWIICSRDLSKVSDQARNRICSSSEQRKYNEDHPYDLDREFLVVANRFLEKLQTVRPFTILDVEIPTNGDFPSTYYFRICDFAMHS